MHEKKYRKETQLFLVEGIKSIAEFILSKYRVKEIYLLEGSYTEFVNLARAHNISLNIISERELKSISLLVTPQQALAIVEIPLFSEQNLEQDYVIALDGIQDPGNLGTIIRTADWFGISNIVCSLDTVEAYNPKVVQASMGSLAHVRLIYTDLEPFLQRYKYPIYGALLDAPSLYTASFAKQGVILMGNEGKGISDQLVPYIQYPIHIPRIGYAESLNVGVATAIICAELRRNNQSLIQSK